MKDVKVLIGNYGSGKSELALNFAMQAAARGDRTELLDLDMVNTYFRLTERGKMVEQKEIRLVSPNFACSGIETLSLPAEVSSAFVLDWDTVIFDVGGDDVGATALGRYAPYTGALRSEMEVLYVVNPCRPLSAAVEDIVDLFRLIERQARLTPDHLVNNANLQEQTTPEVLLAGQALVDEAARALCCPVGMIAGRARLRDALPEALRPLFFSFEPIMKPDWLVDSL